MEFNVRIRIGYSTKGAEELKTVNYVFGKMYVGELFTFSSTKRITNKMKMEVCI